MLWNKNYEIPWKNNNQIYYNTTVSKSITMQNKTFENSAGYKYYKVIAIP